VGSTSSHLIGPAYQAGLDRERRRRGGVFYTPAEVAAGLARLAFADRAAAGGDADRAVAPNVCDLAAGGGAFLLAAAAELAAAGHGRRQVVEELLWGVDLDPGAVEACRRSLATWAAEGGERAVARHVVVGDGLHGLGAWTDAPAGGFDLIVGNPPFQSQLDLRTARRADQVADLRRRLGPVVSPYVDTAALFLVAATQAVTAGGTVVLVLPESVASARDAAPARAAAVERCALTGFWWAGTQVFEAVVDVCAPVLRRGAATVATVPRWTGPSVDPAPSGSVRIAELAAGGPWGSLLAPPSAPPTNGLDHGPTLGDIASATAGFRDQFYGIADHVVDQLVVDQRDGTDAPLGRRRARLVTSGLVDPLRCRWGRAPARYAGRDWSAPTVDLDSLGSADPPLARWGSDRLVPKVVLATQTRVLEPAVDLDGTWWPSVPTIAVVPNDRGSTERLWSVAAVLAAPAVAAWALDRHRGAALARDAIKLAASQVLEVPLPSEPEAWADGAAAAERAQRAADADDPTAWGAALRETGEAMTDAYRSSAAVRDWWLGRLPGWR
jgi:hypothetical protein